MAAKAGGAMTKLVNAKITMNAMRDAWCVERGAPMEPAPDSPCCDDEKCFLNKASYAAFKGEKWGNMETTQAPLAGNG